MIQTTLFNYFKCNGLTQSSVKKVYTFKQTTLTDYSFNIIPKKKNLILNYFNLKNKIQVQKKKEEEKEFEVEVEKLKVKGLGVQEYEREKKEEKTFNLILVDIRKSRHFDINCVKKNIYNPNLKYIAVSYKRGELNEQLVETPDGIARITSFDLRDLNFLCNIICSEPDLKDIRYLWIDAFSIDQFNLYAKKDTILRMSQIYQRAAYILAVPDLHYKYLLKNTANEEILNFTEVNRETIHQEILNNKHSFINSIYDDFKSLIKTGVKQQQNDNQYSFTQRLEIEYLNKKIKELKTELEELKIEMKGNVERIQEMKIQQQLKKAYQFLAYLIYDWSNRAWVISEYHIAKEKYIKHGTPLKYTFISLFNYNAYGRPFFTYYFEDDYIGYGDKNYNELTYREVDDSKTFHQFLKSRFMKRSHLDMILNSSTTKNEDRFNAILPSWHKYNHLIKNKDTIFDWNITDMTSVRLKLYEIMDLWDKATLLYASSPRYGDNRKVEFPTFASHCDMNRLIVIEISCYNNFYKQFEESVLEYIYDTIDEKEAARIIPLMNEYKTNSKTLWTENLISIQFNPHHCYLSVKSKFYFIKNIMSYEREYWSNKLSLNDDDEFHLVFIPFFTFNIPGYIDYPKIYEYSSRIYLVGNIKINKWALVNGSTYQYEVEHFYTDDYIFNVY